AGTGAGGVGGGVWLAGGDVWLAIGGDGSIDQLSPMTTPSRCAGGKGSTTTGSGAAGGHPGTGSPARVSGPPAQIRQSGWCRSRGSSSKPRPMSKYSLTRERGGSTSYAGRQHGSPSPAPLSRAITVPTSNDSVRHSRGAIHAVIANAIALTISPQPARP